MKTIILMLVSLAFYLHVVNANAQQVDLPNDNIIPPSPEASALGKYGEIPVGLYTGTPQIQIPLFEVQEGDITLPIGLSYHASGNKVDEIATRTGLGWTLNAGGVITRTVRGHADEFGAGGFLAYTKKLGSPENFYQGTDEEKYLRYDGLSSRGCDDGEPDSFYFNFMGITGQFSFDWNGQLVVHSERKVTITPLGMNLNTQDYIDGWEVKADNGTTFLFEATETTYMRNWEDKFPCDARKAPVTSWYLSKILSPTGNIIHFEYDAYELSYDVLASETAMHRNGYEQATPKKSFLQLQVRGKKLRKVYSPSGHFTVDFLGVKAREDIQDVFGAMHYSLDEIILKGISGKVAKQYKLNYDYSTNRLTLKSLQQLSAQVGDGVSFPTHFFEYHPGLPSPGSSKQDHWGYANANPETYLLPSMMLMNPSSDQPWIYAGGDRSPDEESMKAGLLNKIIYPTKGSTTLYFESHDYSFLGSQEIKGYATIDREKCESISGNGEYKHRYIDQPFTIGEFATDNKFFKVFYDVKKYSSLPGGTYAPRVEIFRSTDTGEVGESVFSTFGTYEAGERYLKLGQGNYILRVSASLVTKGENEGDQIMADYAYGRLEWKERVGELKTLIKKGGGGRIQKTITSDGLNPEKDVVLRYEYRLGEGVNSISSGSVSGEPQYSYYTQMEENNDYLSDPVTYMVRMSTGKSPLGVTQGSNVGYRQVTVYHGLNGEGGKAVSEFTSPFLYPDNISSEPPFCPPTVRDYHRGLLRKETTYSNKEGVFYPEKEVLNDYQTIETQIPAFKVGFLISGGGTWGPGNLHRYAPGHYYVNLGVSKLKASTETSFIGSQALSVTQQYGYDANLQFLTRHSTTLSNGEQKATAFYYPHDYPSTGVIGLMKQRHLLSPVIEKVTTVSGVGGVNPRVVHAEFTQFSEFNEQDILPAKQFNLFATTPVTDFQLSKDNTGSHDTRYYYSRVAFNSYSLLGRLLQLTESERPPSSYLWGYNLSYPVIKAENVALPDLEQIVDLVLKEMGYTGGISDWETFLAGAGNVTTDSQKATLKMFHERMLVKSANREMRLSIYTYDPLIGITSVTDPNSRTTYYSYDDLNRLESVKDEEGNVIKAHEYHYAGE